MKIIYLHRRDILVGLLAILIQSLLFDGIGGETFSLKDREYLDKFRSLVQDIVYKDHHNEDWYLITWIRAKAYNLPEAKNLLKRSFEWRKSQNVDSLLDDPELKKIEKDHPFWFGTLDKLGRPIIQEKVAAFDVRGAIISGKQNLLRRYELYKYERVLDILGELAINRRNPSNVTSQCVLIGDMNGYSVRSHGCLPCISLSAITDFIKILNDNYPARYNQTIFINAPRSIETVMRLARSFLPAEELKSFRVYGHDKNEWAPVLTNLIAPESKGLHRYGLGT